jgi:hypothetical protein
VARPGEHRERSPKPEQSGARPSSPEAERWRLPDDATVVRLLEEEDSLRIVVRAWQWIEALCAVAIADRLPAGADLVELDRISARVKIDLCAGMGAIPSDAHPSFVRMNSLRNQFVHRQKERLSRKDGLDLFNSWSPGMRAVAKGIGTNGRSNALDLLRATLMLQIAMLQRGIEHFRDEAIHRDLFYEKLFRMADDARRKMASDEGAPSPEDTAEFERRKQARLDAGRL